MSERGEELERKILLVDDDEDDHVIIRDLCADMGHVTCDLTWVTTYDEALEALTHGRYDVCLLDYYLGPHTGLELLRAVDERVDLPPIIMLTGLGDHDVDLEAMRAGAADYLVKGDLTAPLLERAIRYAIRHRRTLDALRESEDRHRIISELTSDFAYDVSIDAEGEFTYEWMTEALHRITGFSIAELRNLDQLQQLVHPEDVPRYTQSVERILAGEPSMNEYRIITKSGEVRWLRTHSRPIWDETAGRVVRFYGAAQDITARKRAEEALQRILRGTSSVTGELFFERLVRELAGWLGVRWVIVSELEATVPPRLIPLAFWADGSRDEMDAYLLAGTPCEQVCDRNALCTFAPGVAQRFPEDEMLALMGVEWYTGVPLHDGAGQVVGVLCALHDTPVEVPTAMEEVFSIFSQRAGVEIVRKRAAELLAQKAQALARSNAELQHFAYIASHDLQEPLRMVTSFLELLKRHCEGQFDAQAEEFWAFAFDGAKRMQHMINDLLTYSRVGTHGQDFAPVDCEDVLERTLTNLRMMIDEQGAQVTGDPLPVVMGDETQLGQLFQNLISNAVKFRGAHPPEVHVGARRMGRTWRFSVRDNGIGIPAKHRERIFLMFQRLHTQEEYPGSGIGLAICQKIVERHGGRIWVESQPGEGSTFYFTLPVSVSSTDR